MIREARHTLGIGVELGLSHQVDGAAVVGFPRQRLRQRIGIIDCSSHLLRWKCWRKILEDNLRMAINQTDAQLWRKNVVQFASKEGRMIDLRSQHEGSALKIGLEASQSFGIGLPIAGRTAGLKIHTTRKFG